jgi:hypothetical protein
VPLGVSEDVIVLVSIIEFASDSLRFPAKMHVQVIQRVHLGAQFGDFLHVVIATVSRFEPLFHPRVVRQNRGVGLSE